ncbi:cellular retinaldehyde-binding/triple function domain-containing protein [Tieghemostelium lacteum]|uniref:Cellular retinaldehyde-binding/triple function domain-containing protein n=1 Tax=Tieghemostelium lacteum TaxID=361077 RepID=A0A151ZGT3_TIELA|nr:cellular retinaldehyde-binding/triple function domain-containing protein [Tieghemostelium lacteum]|eukprot:KYQ93182.1 cellular retinaldehyde-binding/triple function domain-containing protein [Tieghemostelium lacteum]
MGNKKKNNKKSLNKTSTTTTTAISNNSEVNGADKMQELFNPLTNLTAEQIEIFNKFKNNITQLELTDREKEWIDDMLICRYLRARDYDLELAYNLFLGTLEWRKTFKPYEISAEELAHEASTGKSYVYGKSLGRSCIYLTPSRENTKNYEKQIKLLVYNIERAISQMDKIQGHEQLVLVIDFNGYSIFNAPPMNVSKQTLDILSNHYPERLGQAILVDPPMIFNIFFKAISPFINKQTYKKIHFASGSKGITKTFTELFDLDKVSKEYGGNSDFKFSHPQFWSEEIKMSRKERGLSELTDQEILDIIDNCKKD